MSDSVERFWVIPSDLDDMEPLPALFKNKTDIAFYNRKRKCFNDYDRLPFVTEALERCFDDESPVPMRGMVAYCSALDVLAYSTFEECRAAMIEARTQALKEARRHSHELAISIEHIRTIPPALFPNVIREVPEAQQQEAQEQKEAQAKEVKAKPALRRPSRKS
jgi:hypothetical protein